MENKAKRKTKRKTKRKALRLKSYTIFYVYVYKLCLSMYNHNFEKKVVIYEYIIRKFCHIFIKLH